MNALVRQYQQKVIAPEEPVDYANIIMQSYPPQAIQQEPFIGFKALCTDTNAYSAPPAERMRYIDSNLGFLVGKGCIMRETKRIKPDGFWLITLPVPRSQVKQAISNMFDVLGVLNQYFGIVRDGVYDINVSGKCPPNQVEQVLGGINIPQKYMNNLVQTGNIMCQFGNIQRINDLFMCLRTRWNFGPSSLPQTFDDLSVLSQLIASIY